MSRDIKIEKVNPPVVIYLYSIRVWRKMKVKDNEKRYQEAWESNELCNILLLYDGHLNYIYVRGQALRAAFSFFFNTTL
jgi:hypothetical protein